MTTTLAITAAAVNLLDHLGTIGILTVLPLLAIAATSFTKLVVVLGLLRTALGTANIPPASVITAVAAALSLLVMAPVAEEIGTRIEPHLAGGAAQSSSQAGQLAQAAELYRTAAPPLLRFLRENTKPDEIAYFSSLAAVPVPPDQAGLSVLLPAFITTELTEAFIIGLLIFIPFLVVDLIVSNVLLAVGLQSITPATVALPLKLLIFTVADGWQLLLGGVLSTY